jgi:hypothetical protein
LISKLKKTTNIMPEPVKHDAFKAKDDPSVTKQFDEAPAETKFEVRVHW